MPFSFFLSIIVFNQTKIPPNGFLFRPRIGYQKKKTSQGENDFNQKTTTADGQTATASFLEDLRILLLTLNKLNKDKTLKQIYGTNLSAAFKKSKNPPDGGFAKCFSIRATNNVPYRRRCSTRLFLPWICKIPALLYCRCQYSNISRDIYPSVSYAHPPYKADRWHT